MHAAWTTAPDVQAFNFKCSAGSCAQERYNGVGRSQMLCCLFIHRSQIHTSAARILSTRNCFSQSVHSTETNCRLDYTLAESHCERQPVYNNGIF